MRYYGPPISNPNHATVTLKSAVAIFDSSRCCRIQLIVQAGRHPPPTPPIYTQQQWVKGCC